MNLLNEYLLLIALLLSGAITIGCNESNTDSPPNAGDAPLQAGIVSKQLDKSKNPFDALEYKTAAEAFGFQVSDQSQPIHPQKALKSLVQTGADTLDTQTFWQCLTESSNGDRAEVSIRFLGDFSGYVNYEPITWRTRSGDELDVYLPGKGAIRWKNIRFASSISGDMELKAEDRKGEIALCNRV